MTKEENRTLCERYPFLIPRDWKTGEVASDFDYEYTELDNMPEGWRKAYGEALCEELAAELRRIGKLDEYIVLQIKEKFGALRWYGNIRTPEIKTILQRYEDLTRFTCIKCGVPATRVTIAWICPYCENCIPIDHDGEKRYTDPIHEFWNRFDCVGGSIYERM